MIQKRIHIAPKTDAISHPSVVGKPSVVGALLFIIMKEIQLTQGYSTIVDDEDYAELSKHKWCAVANGRNIYAIRRTRRSDNYKIEVHISMHRQILGLTNPSVQVDHIDGNGLNNQRNNLRQCTGSQNASNCRSAKGSSSKYVGVHYIKERVGGKKYRRWAAMIRIKGKQRCLGYFMVEEEAALARDRFILDNNLEFPKLNILKRK